MYFKHIPKLNIFELTLLTGEQLQWDASSWHRSTSISKSTYYHDDPDNLIISDIFDSVNRYVKTLPISQVIEIEGIYKQIYSELEMLQSDIEELDKTLYKLVYELLKKIEWDHLKHWCLHEGGLNIEIGVKDELLDNDSIETTYFTEDYKNLLVFSVLLKFIIGIWGQYYLITHEIIGKDYSLIHCIEYLRNPIIESNPAFIRLYKYVEDQTNNIIKKKNVKEGFSLLNDIGGDEVIEYMLTFVLWKKIITFDGKVLNRSIIGNVFQVISDKLERFGKFTPKQKRVTNKQGEEIARDDVYKITQKLSPAIGVSVEYFIEKHLAHILSVDEQRVYELTQTLVNRLSVLPYHVPIINLVLSEHLGNRSLLLVNYSLMIRCIVITSLKLEQVGLNTLSEILTTIPIEKDIFSMSFIGGTTEQIPLTKEKIQQIKNLYLTIGLANPGIELIDKVIKIINQYKWELTRGQLNLVTQELAELIILQLA